MEPPEWLVRFRAEDWMNDVDTVPPEWGLGDPLWRVVRARELWRAAGRDWLDERGRRDEWFALTRPVVAR